MAKFICNMISYTLQRTVDITVIIPSPTIPESMGMGPGKPSHVPKADYPVLYLLHGFGNNHATWSGYSNVELYAEEQNLAVVMISGENKFYANHRGDPFYDFIENELPEFVTANFPVSKKVKDTFIAGLSMGGYGALIHGLGNPEKYAAVGSFSGAVKKDVIPEGIAQLNPDLSPENIVDKAVGEGIRLPALYVACGQSDFLYDANLEFVDKLKKSRVDVTWVSVEGYEHEWRFWDMQIEDFMKWLPRTDYYAGSIRKV